MAAKKKTMGRPRSEMTPENIDAILRGIRLGLHPERAAQAAGVSVGAFRMHKKRHPEFVMSIKEAESAAEQGFLGRILKHTEKQWTAAAWILERRFPERWRKQETSDVKVTTKQAAPGPTPPQGEDLAGYLERLSAMPGLIRDRVSRN